MASLRSSVPLFRGFAPCTGKNIFSCRHYGSNSPRRLFAIPQFRPNANGRANPAFLHIRARQFFTPSWKRQASTVANTAENAASNSGSSVPHVSSKIVAYWLLGSAASVFGLVVFGGLTRLTESG
jgi:cytochrome c oxidase assembly protein subunit 15